MVKATLRLPGPSFIKATIIMARKSRKAEQLKQELLSTVQQKDLITQPVTFAYLQGEMSVMQARIQTVIMEKLQLRIAQKLKVKATAEAGFAGNLFSEDDFAPIKGEKGNYLKFSVKYSELGILPQNYRYVSDAARAMQGSLVYEREADGYKRYIVAFPIVDVPDETKGERHTDIKLYMTENTANYLFQITPYHRYLKDALFLFASGYTGRIYLLVNANKQLKDWRIGYDELRRILLTARDSETNTYVCNKYPNIKDFKKRVLDVAKKEMDAVASRIDCTFDYEIKRNSGIVENGHDIDVIFHIRLTELGKNIKQGQLESHGAMILRNMLMSLTLTLTDVNRLMKQVPAEKHLELMAKVRELKRYYTDVRNGKIMGVAIKDFRAHAVKSLQNFIKGTEQPEQQTLMGTNKNLLLKSEKEELEW